MLFAADLTNWLVVEMISLVHFSAISPSYLLARNTSYRIQRRNPMILGYDHMKNSQEFTHTQKDIVHLYSMHLATIKKEYNIISLFYHTYSNSSHFSCSCMLVVSCTVVIDCFMFSYLDVLFLYLAIHSPGCKYVIIKLR